ncbi:MAG: helix-turn-helix transcriptional regulator [Acidobacteria bacterium]|nr:helix-turn-helix transcriptional regulator [Acidobacteriota bacterium]
MARHRAVNHCVRQKLRELRLRKKISLQELAYQAGIPSSSYACMEGGFYNISLDNLFRILGVLETDIDAVWPIETEQAPSGGHPFYLKKIQEFRLNEIVSLSEAEGAALFSLQNGKCSVVLHQHLSDFLLDRLILYLEEGRRYEHGLWFEKKQAAATFYLFLKTQDCRDYVRKLIEHYLAIWSQLFGGPLAGADVRNNR